MIPDFIDKSLIPHKPGVYLYRDHSGSVIYVGKALDLYHRVSSYFSRKHLEVGDKKTAVMVSKIAYLETIIVASELEALILEANLIKKYLPPFNIRLTDDKDYLYIKVTKELYPKIMTARKQDLPDAIKSFGPFPSSRTVRDTLKQLRRVFPWCANPPVSVTIDNMLRSAPQKTEVRSRVFPRPCFYYHIGLCPGPCAGKISSSEYKIIINRFITFMEGRHRQLVEELIEQMNTLSTQEQFEQAARVKKMIEGINYLTQANRAQVYLENPNFLEDQRMKALKMLQKALQLPSIPERIEGYDISNVQGREATASMVVLTNGEIDKSQYRKFKIKPSTDGLGKPNDYAMHQETMRRRMKHSEWKYPDMLLIDGGKGQVSAVHIQIQQTGSEEFKKIPIFGIAKRMEWLYSVDGKEIRLPRSHAGLQLLQQLRDEAHRFAITYHRKLHRQAAFD